MLVITRNNMAGILPVVSAICGMFLVMNVPHRSFVAGYRFDGDQSYVESVTKFDQDASTFSTPTYSTEMVSPTTLAGTTATESIEEPKSYVRPTTDYVNDRSTGRKRRIQYERQTDTATTTELPTTPGLPTGRKNVLFIMVDDLRALMRPFHDPTSQFSAPRIRTPNLKRLAAKSLVLKRFFVQYSLCGPSRTSMLTSRRPDTTRMYKNGFHWRYETGNFTTIPQYFKENGYYTVGAGKLFHIDLGYKDNDPLSWTEGFVSPNITLNDKRHIDAKSDGNAWISVTKREQKLAPLTDTQTLAQVGDLLVKAKSKQSEQPFFLGVGFYRPHQMFICPKKFFKRQPIEKKKQFLSDTNWQQPIVFNTCILPNVTKIDDDFGFVPHETLRLIRQSYFACVSYVDMLIGEILKTLEALDLQDSTIISFVSDHGFHLGENGKYGKLTVYDVATRVPMMLHVPGRTDKGLVSEAITEGIDLLPTIAEAAGLDKVPNCPENSTMVRLCTEGTSFLPLLDNVNRTIKEAAISQLKIGQNQMVYSIRTKRYRYITMADRTFGYVRLVGNNVYHPEQLYDHLRDPEERFNRNRDKKYSKAKAKLRRKLEWFLQ